MEWRDHIRAARSLVHEAMASQCLHYSPDGTRQGAVRVRYQYSRGALGDLQGADGAGERYALPSAVIFDSRDFTPAANDLLVFESGGVLQVGPVYPPDMRTDFRRAEVAQLEPAVYSRYPFLAPDQPWAGLDPPEED